MPAPRSAAPATGEFSASQNTPIARRRLSSWRQRAEAGAARYSRRRDLSALLPLWPRELADFSEDGTRVVIFHLQRALRRERRQGVAGHWSYDLSRHMALLSALKAEQQRLSALAKR